MAVYKVEIKPITSFVGNITSNTLFGALCFSIRDIYGEDVLAEVFKNGEDGIVVSNLFPHNTIPNQDIQDRYIDIDTGESVIDEVVRTTVIHNISNRSTESCGASKKWKETETWSNKSYDFYIKTAMFDRDDIEHFIKLVLINGIGKGRNRGKGRFRLVGIEEVDSIGKEVNRPNGYMVLSDYIPKENDSTIGVYNARVYQGATGGIKKTPILLINAGSTFIGSLGEDKVGVIGRNYLDKITNTYISGLAIAIPAKV